MENRCSYPGLILYYDTRSNATGNVSDNDVLYSGDGANRFVYGDAEFGRDRIEDFEDGTDLLDFSGARSA